MSEQGSSLHFRKLSIAQTKKKLATLEGSCAILASNRRWTSFVPLDQASLDVARVSQLLAVTVLQVWFDEDSAVVLQIFAPDGWQAELTVPLDGTYEFGPEDERFFHGMAERKRLPSALIKELTRKMRQSQGRDSWLRSHGLEETLGLPFVIPLPVPCTEELLREIVPDAEVVRGVKKGTGKSVLPTLPQGPVARRTWSSSERAIVDLHFHYLMNLWSMNDWKVYYRYKKHLPAERRGGRQPGKHDDDWRHRRRGPTSVGKNSCDHLGCRRLGCSDTRPQSSSIRAARARAIAGLATAS